MTFVGDVRDPSVRVARSCTACGQVDDHPRHIHALPDGTDQVLHLDCCAAQGCPTAGGDFDEHSCGARLAAAGGVTREPLIEWLTSKEGWAHAAKANRLGDARVTARQARQAVEDHGASVEFHAAAAEHSQRLLRDAEATIKNGGEGK